MDAATLEIIERSLQYSLWAFLGVFLLSLLAIRHRLRSRRKGLQDLREDLDREYQQKWTGPAPTTPTSERFVPSQDESRMAFHTLLLSTCLAAVCFLALTLIPLPFLENLATLDPRSTVPLRVTALNYDRFHEGFSLKGEIWNQEEEPLGELTAVVKIWGTDEALLDELSVDVKPKTLKPKSSGNFTLRYSKNSPFLFGYEIHFFDQTGDEVPHVKGFDVR